MARDVDGDGLGEIMIYDRPCSGEGEPRRGFLRVMSGADEHTLVDLEWMAEFGGFRVSRPRLL